MRDNLEGTVARTSFDFRVVTPALGRGVDQAAGGHAPADRNIGGVARRSIADRHEIDGVRGLDSDGFRHHGEIHLPGGSRGHLADTPRYNVRTGYDYADHPFFRGRSTGGIHHVYRGCEIRRLLADVLRSGVQPDTSGNVLNSAGWSCARRSRICDKRDLLAATEPLQNFFASFGFVELEVTEQRLGNAEMFQQLARMAGVFCGDEIAFARCR